MVKTYRIAMPGKKILKPENRLKQHSTMNTLSTKNRRTNHAKHTGAINGGLARGIGPENPQDIA